MKATGIIRRIDELGRVVIPKEIRRTIRIREGDPLEIFVEMAQLFSRNTRQWEILKLSVMCFVTHFKECPGRAQSLILMVNCSRQIHSSALPLPPTCPSCRKI